MRCSAPLDAQTPGEALLRWVLHVLRDRGRCIGCARPGGKTVLDILTEARREQLQ